MEKVKYEIKKIRGVKISTTLCTRLKRVGVLVGTGECMACSYCYGVKKDEQSVSCRKIISNYVDK